MQIGRSKRDLLHVATVASAIAATGMASIGILLSQQTARQTNSDRGGAGLHVSQLQSSHSRNCPAAYFRSLQTIGATAGQRLQAAANLARRGDPALPRYWLFWQPGRTAVQRKLARIGASSSVIVVEDRICTRSVLGKGGRIRCLKWEPKPENFKPPPPSTPSTPEVGEPAAQPSELKHLNALSGFVRTGGAIGVLRRRGRLHELTKRVGSELLGYLGQEMRPTLCTGGMALVDFYARQLAPLTARIEASARRAVDARMIARHQVELASNVWKAKRVDAAGRAVNLAAETKQQAGKDGRQAALLRTPENLGAMVLGASEVMLPREFVGHIRAESDDFARLVRAREAMSAGAASEAPPHVYATVFRAFRAIEVAYYADLNSRIFMSYGHALKDLLKSTAESHQRDCTCD